MSIKKHIPNYLTLGNLFCGTIATIFAVKGFYNSAALFVMLGIIFDFFDGFVARLLKVSGELGKQLDSLADVVTSGVVPGIIMASMIQNNLLAVSTDASDDYLDISLIGLILTLGACYRLAKFNLDARQSDSFIGLPTPAMSLFVISLPLIQQYSDFEIAKEIVSNNYCLIVITLVLTYFMNAEIPLFSLKFKDYSIKNNLVKYLFLLVSLILILTLTYSSLPIIILTYILFSMIYNITVKKQIS